jgi:hypothetical protein
VEIHITAWQFRTDRLDDISEFLIAFR